MNTENRHSFGMTHFNVKQHGVPCYTALPLGWLIVVAMIAGPSIVTYGDDAIQSTSASKHEFRFLDLDGKTYTLNASEGKKGLVLIFVTTDCPIANSYQPLLTRLFHEYKSKDFEFVLVQEGLEQTMSKLKEHASEYSIACAVVMDAEHTIAHKLGATKTPEAFVLGRDATILYQGRIDNLYQGFGKKRSSATRDDLRIALMEIDSGDKVSVPKTESIGCSIPPKGEAHSKP